MEIIRLLCRRCQSVGIVIESLLNVIELEVSELERFDDSSISVHHHITAYMVWCGRASPPNNHNNC